MRSRSTGEVEHEDEELTTRVNNNRGHHNEGGRMTRMMNIKLDCNEAAEASTRRTTTTKVVAR
jgi:hypothetical protein